MSSFLHDGVVESLDTHQLGDSSELPMLPTKVWNTRPVKKQVQ